MYPVFEQNKEYIELRGGKYRFKLLKPVTIQLPELNNHKGIVSLRDGSGFEWARIIDNTFTANIGYAWNGASPKWCIPLIGWVGTPDPHSTRLGTLFHDIMYQFILTADFPISVKMANLIFRRVLIYNGFKWSNTYFGAVEDFGNRAANGPLRNGEHSVRLS